MTGDELVRIASQDTLEAVRDRIGETGDTGGTYNSGTLTSKANAALLALGGVNNGIDGLNNRLDGVVTPYGKGTYGDLIVSPDLAWPSQDGFNRYVLHTKSMTIPEGVTLTPPDKCDGLYILSQGDVTINGVIDVRGKRKTFTEDLQLAPTINVGNQEFLLAKGGYSPIGGINGRGGTIKSVDSVIGDTPTPIQTLSNSVEGNVNGGGVGQYAVGGASVIYYFDSNESTRYDEKSYNYDYVINNTPAFSLGPNATYNYTAPGALVIIAKGNVIINGNILAQSNEGNQPTIGSGQILYYTQGTHQYWAYTVSGDGAIPPSGGGAVTIICNQVVINGSINTNGYKLVAQDKPDLRNDFPKAIQQWNTGATKPYTEPDYNSDSLIWRMAKDNVHCSEGGKGGTFISTAGEIKVYTGVSE